MADGDIILRTPGRLMAVLLDQTAGSGSDNGVWVDCSEYASGTVVITGATGACVVEVDGYNDMRTVTSSIPPSNATNTAPIATTTAATDTFVSIPVLPQWIKARIKTSGTGTVTAVFVGRANVAS